MKILITGGAGFIGTSLIKKLPKEKFIVCSKNNKTKNFDNKNIIYECVNIESDNFLDIVTNHKPDILIHMAAFAGLKQCEENPSQAFTTNVYGTFNVVRACSLNKIRLIFLSSREVYGQTVNEIDEKHSLKPTNVYGISKLLAEKIILSEHKKSGLEYIILRLSNVFGPGGKSGINKIIQSAIQNNKIFLYGGDQTINLIYIDNFIDILKKILINEQCMNQIFNVGMTKNILAKRFSEIVVSICHNNIKIIQRPPLNFENNTFIPNINKLKKIIDYNSEIEMTESIKKTIKWFEQVPNERKK
jgi:UDP-glucose 4-epimerase